MRQQELAIPVALGQPIVVPEEDQPSLGVLVERVAAGDRVAFEDLLDRVGCGLLSHARRFLDEPASTEAVRDTLVDVWRRAPRASGAAEEWVALVFERQVRARLLRA
jgi:RNA polymerase sigma-70 factor, ECF subfamily